MTFTTSQVFSCTEGTSILRHSDEFFLKLFNIFNILYKFAHGMLPVEVCHLDAVANYLQTSSAFFPPSAMQRDLAFAN